MKLQEITENMNSNGGGLATEITGKYESNRNALARNNKKKRTAGQVAQSLRKKGYDLYYKDIKPLLTEWHHAGFIPKNAGGGMARTYYTEKSNEEIFKEYEILQAKIKVKSETKLTGFYYIWESDYSGNYGKKKNFKVCKFFEGSELNRPRYNFTKCTKKELKNSDLYDGQKFYGWDEPTL